MGYHDRDHPEPEAPPALSTAQFALAAGVRAIGVAVLLLGLWAGVKVILEAWALYEQPQRIERLASAIQQGSNIDGVIGSLAVPGEEAGEEAAGAGAAPRPAGGGFRLSYFAAWFIALLLMFVIGSLAMAAITTGGRLALYDLTVKQHSRAVIREVQRLRRAA